MRRFDGLSWARGLLIAVTLAGVTEADDLILVPAEGGRAKLILSSDRSLGSPIWSPMARRLWPS